METQTVSEERSFANNPQAGRGFFGRLNARYRIKLVGAAGGVLLALLIAPGTRRLFLAQAGLTLPVPTTVASVAGSEVGIKPDPFEGAIAYRAAHAVAAQHPDDLQIQIANATLLDGNGADSRNKVQRLRALEGRFADQPALYANILRYETQGEVQARHGVQQYEFAEKPVTNAILRSAAQSVDQAAYAAYDRDALAGERLDPDNAYFPLMRAVGLFGVGRDAEALAEVESASHKPLWREYYDEELQGQWRLQDAACMNNSALFHTLSAAALLFPQYAQMRASARLTTYAAMQAEQAGRIDDGLALRQAVLHLGGLMRIKARNLIGSLVGISFTEIAITRPGGAATIKINEQTEKLDREKLRRQFDAYLQHNNRMAEIPVFHGEEQAGDEFRYRVPYNIENSPLDRLQSLVCWWTLDMLTLSNILWLFVFGSLATLFLRGRGSQAGQRLSRSAGLALPLGLIGGAVVAPMLLTRFSPYFQAAAGMEAEQGSLLRVGFAVALLVLLLPKQSGEERIARLKLFGGGMLGGMILTGFYFWQLRGIAGIADLMQVVINLSDVSSQGGPDPAHVAPWSTAAVSLLICLMASIISLAYRVPLSVGLARAFRGLMAPVAAALFLAYGTMMLCTVREEATTQYRLDRALENEIHYIADTAGK